MKPKMGIALAFMAIVSALAFAACGSSGSDTSNSSGGASGDATETGGSTGNAVPANLQKLAKEATQAPSRWGGPLTSPSPAPNKLLVGIPCGKAAEGCAVAAEGAEEAAEALGWRYKEINPEFDINKSLNAIDQAVNLGAAAIVLAAIQPEQVEPALKRAQKAGVAVLAVNSGLGAEATKHGVDYEVETRTVEEGEALGAYLTVQTNCEAKVGILQNSEFLTLVQRLEGTEKALGECPGNKVVATELFSITELETTFGQKSQAFLRANPEVEIAWIPYSSAVYPLANEAKQPGGISPEIVSFDADPGLMPLLESEEVIAAVGFPLRWAGWAAVDAANRITQEQEVPSSYGIPYRILTPPDAAEFADSGYTGDVNYKEKFEELWSTGKTDSSVTPAG